MPFIRLGIRYYIFEDPGTVLTSVTAPPLGPLRSPAPSHHLPDAKTSAAARSACGPPRTHRAPHSTLGMRQAPYTTWALRHHSRNTLVWTLRWHMRSYRSMSLGNSWPLCVGQLLRNYGIQVGDGMYPTCCTEAGRRDFKNQLKIEFH